MSEAKDNYFFSEEAIKTLLNKLNFRGYKDSLERNNLILDLIRLKQPISKYELAKLSGLSYPTIKQIVKEMAFCNLVKIKVSVGENGLPVKLVFITNLEEKNEE